MKAMTILAGSWGITRNGPRNVWKNRKIILVSWSKCKPLSICGLVARTRECLLTKLWGLVQVKFSCIVMWPISPHRPISTCWLLFNTLCNIWEWRILLWVAITGVVGLRQRFWIMILGPYKAGSAMSEIYDASLESLWLGLKIRRKGLWFNSMWGSKLSI